MYHVMTVVTKSKDNKLAFEVRSLAVGDVAISRSLISQCSFHFIGNHAACVKTTSRGHPHKAGGSGQRVQRSGLLQQTWHHTLQGKTCFFTCSVLVINLHMSLAYSHQHGATLATFACLNSPPPKKKTNQKPKVNSMFWFRILWWGRRTRRWWHWPMCHTASTTADWWHSQNTSRTSLSCSKC